MKKLLISLLCLAGFSSLSEAAFTPTIISTSTLQVGTTVYTSSGTILNLSVSTITPSVGILGNTSGASAPTGMYGQYISSTTAGKNCAASGAFDDWGQINLTPGTWLIWVGAQFNNNGATWSEANHGYSTTSGNSSSGLVSGENRIIGTWANSSSTPIDYGSVAGPTVVTVSNTTTYYHKFKCTYTANGPPVRQGIIAAIRIY